MCWCIKEKHLKIKTAVKDIECFKVMSKERPDCSFFYPFYWVAGVQEYEKNIFEAPNIQGYNKYIIVKSGFHSYSTKCTIINKGEWMEIMFGKHSIFRYYSDNIMRCIIPKGCNYIINEWGEIVSDTLIPIGFEKTSPFMNNDNFFVSLLEKIDKWLWRRTKRT